MSVSRNRADVYDASDAAQVAKRQGEEKRRRDRDADDMRAVLGTDQGRRVIWRLMEHCGVFRSTFTGHGARDAFNEGARNVGLFVMGEMIAADPDALTSMMQESKKDV